MVSQSSSINWPSCCSISVCSLGVAQLKNLYTLESLLMGRIILELLSLLAFSAFADPEKHGYRPE